MATGLRSEKLSPEYSRYKAVKELVDRFNGGELDYLPTKDKEQIAMIAAQMGIDFDVKSKPVKKALFDFVDTALFGIVPNKWRPKSVGEEYFGQTGLDKFASGVGSLGGLLTGGYGAIKGAGSLAGKLGSSGMMGRAAGKFSSAGEKAISYGKQKGTSLWEMTSEQGNRLRSTILNNRFYQSGAPKARSAYNQGMSYGSDFLSRGREFIG